MVFNFESDVGGNVLKFSIHSVEAYHLNLSAWQITSSCNYFLFLYLFEQVVRLEGQLMRYKGSSGSCRKERGRIKTREEENDKRGKKKIFSFLAPIFVVPLSLIVCDYPYKKKWYPPMCVVFVGTGLIQIANKVRSAWFHFEGNSKWHLYCEAWNCATERSLKA